MKKINVYSSEILYFLVFIGFFLFYTQGHRLVLFDGDDWFHLSFTRLPIPLWGAWNPIKVLPETLMPFCGWIAAYVVNPIVNDYLNSVTITCSLAVALLITFYVATFNNLIKTLFSLRESESAVLSLFFISLHFSLFKGLKVDNASPLLTLDLTCIFHYIVPFVVNAIMVMWFIMYEKGCYKSCETKLNLNTVAVVGLYMAIFSNCLHSSLLALFVFSDFIIKVVLGVNRAWSFRRILDCIIANKLVLHIILIFVWLISLIYEANGGRAGGFANDFFHLPIGKTITHLGIYLAESVSIGVIYLLIPVCFAILIFIKKNHYHSLENRLIYVKHIFFVLLATISLLIVYLVIVCSKLNSVYIARMDVLNSLFFLVFLLVGISLAYLIQVYKNVNYLFIAGMLISVMSIFNLDGSFRYCNMTGNSPEVSLKVSNYILNQFVNADENGSEKWTLYVPKGNDVDNWPHPVYMPERIAQTLFKHDIISRVWSNDDIKIEIDESINKKFALK